MALHVAFLALAGAWSLPVAGVEVQDGLSMMLDASEQLSRPGPWLPGPLRLRGGRKSLCIEGKQVPELYILGAAKAATTTLSTYLKAAGAQCVHDSNTQKEFHFFDSRMTWDWPNQAGYEKRRKFWLSTMPTCPARAGRHKDQLLGDFTPANLRMVPLPAGSGRFGRFPPWRVNHALGNVPKGGIDPVNLPPLLKRFYGEDAGRLRFVVLLREPLARMQSAWYHAHSTTFTNMCVDCRAPSFVSALEAHMDKAQEDPPVYSDWLWTGMYARQIEEWLAHFEPSQLLVIPTLHLNAVDGFSHGGHAGRNLVSVRKQESRQTSVCHALVSHMHFPMRCGATMSSSHGPYWSHPHPSLSEDVPAERRREFAQFMAPELDRLVEVLARAYEDGAKLAGFVGDKDSSEDHVREWLLNGW